MPAYAACDKAEVVAVADLNLERAEAFAKRFGIPHAYASVEELLANEDIDAVDVCTWNNGHAPGWTNPFSMRLALTRQDAARSASTRLSARNTALCSTTIIT